MFPEDFLRPGSILTISSIKENPFISSLEKLIKSDQYLGIAVREIILNTQDIWFRDYFVPFEDAQGTLQHLLPLSAQFYRARNWKKKLHHLKNSQGSHYYHARAIQAKIQLYTMHEERRGNSIATSLLQHGNNKHDNAANIEGGNMFSVYNKNGLKYILLGEMSLLFTAAQINKITDYNKETIHTHVANVFSLPQEQLLVLPQAGYHLDLQIAYLGEGNIALNDYSLCVRTLEQMLKNPSQFISDQELSDLNQIIDPIDTPSATFFPTLLLTRKQILTRMLELAKKLDNLYGDQIEQIFTKLTEQQFTVIRVPGVFYYPNKIKDSINPIPLAQFMNGIAGKDCNKQTYFLTANSCIEHLKSIFTTYLQNFMINRIYYLGNSMLATNFIHQSRGSLRCLTTMYLEQEDAPLSIKQSPCNA